jgi:broad specificity phosphatase PhoE
MAAGQQEQGRQVPAREQARLPVAQLPELKQEPPQDHWVTAQLQRAAQTAQKEDLRRRVAQSSRRR